MNKECAPFHNSDQTQIQHSQYRIIKGIQKLELWVWGWVVQQKHHLACCYVFLKSPLSILLDRWSNLLQLSLSVEFCNLLFLVNKVTIPRFHSQNKRCSILHLNTNLIVCLSYLTHILCQTLEYLSNLLSHTLVVAKCSIWAD